MAVHVFEFALAVCLCLSFIILKFVFIKYVFVSAFDACLMSACTGRAFVFFLVCEFSIAISCNCLANCLHLAAVRLILP